MDIAQLVEMVMAALTFLQSPLTTVAHMQDAADKAEKNADPLAEKATNKAGEAAHTAVKTTREKWEEVKPEEKVDQYADKASKTVQASPVFSPEVSSHLLAKGHTDSMW